MDTPFSRLPAARRAAITRAALEVFGSSDYKRASTDEIAARAGISKGLLFYYFRNKRSLYLYLLRYMYHLIERHMRSNKVEQIHDFFEIMDTGVEQKLALFEATPWVLEFAVRAWYCSDREVAPAVRSWMNRMRDGLYDTWFSGIDTSKFRPGVDPRQVLDMLIWMTDGYLHGQLMAGRPLELSDILKEYRVWCAALRRWAYKEEYQCVHR